VTTASSSIPDLRSSKKLGKVFLVGGAVAVAAAMTIGIVFAAGNTTSGSPGSRACDQIEELAKKNPEYWDNFVAALARTVERRAWESAKPRDIEITGDTRYERCTNAFSEIKDTVSYRSYEKIASCVGDAKTWRAGSECFDKF
jgi:hypothetical protein